MLSLEPPFYLVDGVSVFRDHVDRRQWYFLPVAPHLTTVPDPVGDLPIPQFSLVKFRGTAGTGGFVNFDVDLGVDEETLAGVAREVARSEDLDDPPRLVPVPLVDGWVRLMLFDAQSPEPPVATGGGSTSAEPAVPPTVETAGAEGLRFVLALSHSAHPALYGDNRAAFSVRLTQEGVTVLEKALQGELAPIGIVYRLEFVGLRPAYHVRVHADWDRVQRHLEEHTSTSVLGIFQGQIDSLVDELVEERVIVIESDLFVTAEEAEAGAGVVARHDEALQDVRDMVTETFFEPSLEPIERQDTVESTLQAVARVAGILATSGASEQTLFRYRKSDVSRTDRKRLDVSMSERTAVRRSIYPQGHLRGLFRPLRDGGVDLARFVSAVDLDDPWFERRRLTVISRADTVADHIRSIDVGLDYGGEPRDVLLETPGQREEVSWPSVLDSGTMRRGVDCRYAVNFAGVDGTERPIRLESDVTTVEVDNVEIDPRSLYTVVPVSVLALDFPWDRYPRVEVLLQYADPAKGISQSDEVVLTEDHPEGSWPMFVIDPAVSSYRYRVTYRATDLRDRVDGWRDNDEESIVLRDPLPTGRSLDIVPVLEFATVDLAFVDVTYSDPSHGIRVDKSFTFSEAQKLPQTFQVALEDPERREVGYRVTIVKKDGEIIEVPPSLTLANRVMVRADMRGHRIVRIAPEPVDFALERVAEIAVDVRYIDADHGLSISDSFTFRSLHDRAVFEFDYVDDGPTSFDVRTRTRHTNNLTSETDWRSQTDDEVLVAVGRD